MSENLTFKYKINDLVVDIDSKEEVIENLMKNNEGKLIKLNNNETYISTIEQSQTENEVLISELQNEINVKNDNNKELTDNLKIKKKKIDDLKTQYKSDHKKLKDSLKGEQ